MNKKLEQHYDQIIKLNTQQKIGYKKLAKMFNCSKSAIEWIVKNKNATNIEYKSTIPENHLKKDLILEEVKRRQKLENKKRLKKKQIKDFWSNNVQFGSNNDIILPVGNKL